MNRTRFALGIGLMLAPALGTACKTEPSDSTAPATAGTTPSESSPKASGTEGTKPTIELPPGDGPVATVNGVAVPRDLFNREYRQTMERYQRARHDVKPALRERLKDNIVRRLVDAEVIRQQAKKLEIAISAEEMATKWAAHKKRYGSEEAFSAFLDRAGTTADDVKRTFETNLIRERVFAEVSKNVTVEGSEVQAFFKDNEKRYEEPEQVKASHILFRVASGAPPADKDAKKKRAKEVLARVKKGEDFAKLAEEFGEDPTKSRGGDLGFFTRGRMVKAFEEAVWKLPKGSISGLVETQFGIHIIKKTDHRPARKKKFSEVRDQIERSLVARKRNQTIRESLDTWKKEADLKIILKGNPEVIAAGQPRPVAPGVQKPRKVIPQNTPQKLELKVQPAVPDTRDSPPK